METELENIKLLYSDCKYNNDILTIYMNNGVCVILNKELNECYAGDNNGNNYTDKLNDIIKFVSSIDGINNKYITILQYFSDNFYLIPGAIVDNNSNINDQDNYLKYDGPNDFFWSMMLQKYNVDTNRKLIITTYGVKFIKEHPKTCQQVYNAGILRLENKQGCQLSLNYFIKKRGTCLLIQEQTRGAILFTTFMDSIISDIEKNNYTSVGIFCSAGHHRSVACAEMLKNLYKNIVIKHLTINK